MNGPPIRHSSAVAQQPAPTGAARRRRLALRSLWLSFIVAACATAALAASAVSGAMGPEDTVRDDFVLQATAANGSPLRDSALADSALDASALKPPAVEHNALAQSARKDPVPDDSVYRLTAEFTDQRGEVFRLEHRRGRPQLVAMFYTSCRYVCPLIVDSAKGVEHALTPQERDSLGIVLVTLDPERDDTAALQRVFERRKLDAARWTLARTDAQNVRNLAALLGVRYRALADGEFNHTSALVLLDDQGRRIATSSALGAVPDPAFLAAVRATIGRGVHQDDRY